MKNTLSKKITKQTGLISQNLNYLATELIEWLGNKNPKQKQIDLIETFLSEASIQHKLRFDNRLTQREISCLFLAAQGITTEGTADILKIKPTTVITFRNNIMRKLGCKTMPHAIFRGIKYGYIQPES